MDRYKILLTLIAGLSLIAGSCANLKQPSLKIDFYTLEYAPPRAEDLDAAARVIRVRRFSVAPMYNTNQMIYRDSAFKRMAYHYHKWRANPGDLVTYFLARDMKQSGLFQAVLPQDSQIPAPWVMEGSVDEFFEWDAGEAWKAALAVTVTLMAEDEPDISKRILFQRAYRTREVCKQKNPGALAEAMSRAMAKVSGEIIRDIYDALNR
jgi:ABC-type uncharacterized transport system auxiliary subunit